MRHSLIVAAAVLSFAGVASAQGKNPMSYEALTHAKQGAWAEYSMTMPGAPDKLKVRYAVVAKNERELTLDTDSSTPMGPMHSSMVFAPTPPDTLKLVKATMQMGTQPQMDLPAAKLSEGTLKKTDTPGKLVGSEKITVPGGTFDTKHYKQVLPPEAGGVTLDVWMSDKVVPTGVVKLTGGGGIEILLTQTGMGAKPKPMPAATESGKTEKPAAPAEKAPAKK